MRKTLVTTMALALLFAAPVLFADPAPDNQIEVSVDAWSADFNGLSDRLAGRVQGEDLDYNFLNFGGAYPYFGGDSNVDSPMYLGLDDESDTAPAFQFNYIRRGKHGVGISYAQAKGSDSQRTFLEEPPDGGLRPSTLDPTYWTMPFLGMPLVASDVAADFGAELTEWSVYYIRVLNRDNDDSQWRALLGWSFIDYEQNDTQRWGWEYGYDESPGDLYMYSATGDSDISAHGPMVGLAGSQRIGNVEGLRVHGAASFAYLTGTASAKRTEVYDPQADDPDNLVYAASRDTEETVTKMNLELGGSYTFDFGLELRLGYRLSRWANLPDSPIASATTTGEIEDRDRDVSVTGFYAGLGWRWGWSR